MKKFLSLFVAFFIPVVVFAECNFQYVPLGNFTQNSNTLKAISNSTVSTQVNKAPISPVLAVIAAIVLDPYVVNIDGIDYYMIKDHGYGKWDIADVLGLGDKPDEMFMALKKLDFDGDDSKLSAQELAYNRIRFVALNKRGVLELKDSKKDFPLEKIEYIDLKTLRLSDEAQMAQGVFGFFDVVIKADDNSTRIVVGKLTFDHAVDIKKLLKQAK